MERPAWEVHEHLAGDDPGRPRATRLLGMICQPTSRASGTAFAQRVAGPVAARPLPVTCGNTLARTTFDTPENRFVRYFVEFLTELLDRVPSTLRLDRGWRCSRSSLDSSTRQSRCVRSSSPGRRRDFLEEVGPMLVFPASSQVLQRAAATASFSSTTWP